jgi:hypothetical protein
MHKRVSKAPVEDYNNHAKVAAKQCSARYLTYIQFNYRCCVANLNKKAIGQHLDITTLKLKGK